MLSCIYTSFETLNCATERKALYHYQKNKLDGKAVTILRNNDNSGFSVVSNDIFDRAKRWCASCRNGSSKRELSHREISELTHSEKYQFQTYIINDAHKYKVSVNDALRRHNNEFLELLSTLEGVTENDLSNLKMKHTSEMNKVLSILPQTKQSIDYSPGRNSDYIARDLAGESPSDIEDILARYRENNECNPFDSEETKWKGAVIDHLMKKYGIEKDIATSVLKFKLKNNLPTLHIAFARYLQKEKIVPSFKHALILLKGYQKPQAENTHLGDLLNSGVHPRAINRLLTYYPNADLELYSKIIVSYSKNDHIVNYDQNDWHRILDHCYCEVVANQVNINYWEVSPIMWFYRDNILAKNLPYMNFLEAKKACEKHQDTLKSKQIHVPN